jgi:(p)ppGpp synthase/HD superfamily hydrolase
MANKKIDSFKEIMKKGMIENFKSDGFLTPIMFFMKDNQAVVSEIPKQFLKDSEGKNKLADIIKNVCKQPNVIAGGIIIEAYAKSVKKNDEMSKLLLNGSVRVSELKEKEDIIMMIFSTPVNEETIAYYVDCKNKTIGEPLPSSGSADGIFSSFFDWNKN